MKCCLLFVCLIAAEVASSQQVTYPLHAGDVLKLFFPVGEGDASLPVFSEVMWSRPADGEYRAGLRFLV